MNPLLTPFDTPPFSKIKNEHFKPAFIQAIEDARSEIDAITSNSEAPDFKNSIESLDYAGLQLDRISSVFFNLNSAETNEEIQRIAQEVSPLLSEFSNDVTLNRALFERVNEVYQQRHELKLSAEQATLLEKKYKNFSRNGAHLGEKEKEKLRYIDIELAKLKLKFGENVLAETNRYEMHLTVLEDMDGLPQAQIEAATRLAKERSKEGWIITLDFPSYIPFMKYARNRELRKKLALAYGRKGFQGDDYDNQQNVIKIARLRHERAQLLGYPSHAHYVLEERMADSPEKVIEFLQELLEKAMPVAKEEFKKLEEFAQETDGIDILQKWDSAYYSEKLKQKLFDLDDEILKPYFPLPQVLDGVFMVANKLFGLRFEKVEDVETYHKEVITYRVYDSNDTFISLFYADFYPRAGKRGGAWMTSFRSQYVLNGQNIRPQVSNVCNFTRPTEKEPSLLTFNEVKTLFHEFGHALHGILANTNYPSLSGTSVYWDFVELPSQIMENWCYEKEALELFAKHYKTTEPIPMEIIDRLKESSTFHEGMATLRQLSFGLLDMAWHSKDPSSVTSVKELEEKAFENTRLFPATPETCMSTAFSHIFQGGYSSGYYSYKWAEVLDADAFAYFKEKGIFNREVAKSFSEHILSKGGTEKPMVLYKRFRGSEPGIEALLERSGLVNKVS
ncbi:MAG: M3 family metallopeptidase [Flavobacteriaceae bacterium]